MLKMFLKMINEQLYVGLHLSMIFFRTLNVKITKYKSIVI